ncbi:uncharacterized protein LY89DRAFT_167959 [Mollisia scopiformis]|uniref:Uncharacterized protein n=1 Tax=Mollisia scopiformis TaxID=149040 RepID=A0A194XSE9_MOLSC|nr:uncharacterized protein LY89DRAFT_167959 [Mollisia scopiformis]KUJ23123.1 hypothetical protein LY89DRAFT_167959 [Mollisia scopiformis]
MSFLLRTSRLSIAAAARPAVPLSTRGFMSSSVRALKEDDHTENQGEHNERHKQDQLQKQKEGKGHWKPELASNSEEAVAADRQAGSDSIEEMQKKTADHAEKKHKHGTSQDPGF